MRPFTLRFAAPSLTALILGLAFLCRHGPKSLLSRVPRRTPTA